MVALERPPASAEDLMLLPFAKAMDRDAVTADTAE